jgi:hypothetical protein
MVSWRFDLCSEWNRPSVQHAQNKRGWPLSGLCQPLPGLYTFLLAVPVAVTQYPRSAPTACPIRTAGAGRNLFNFSVVLWIQILDSHLLSAITAFDTIVRRSLSHRS